MEIPALQRQVQAAGLPMERLAGNTHLSEARKVAEVSRQFEAVLLRQILAEARKNLFAPALSPRSVAGDIYQDMITNQLADGISRSGGFGLARSLEAQLQHEAKALRPPAAGGDQV
jgi:flagellar protein FlgJ